MAISRQQIIAAINEGISNADLKYEKWTHGSSVIFDGVESLMVANIAESLNRRQDPEETLYLEYSFDNIIEKSGARRPRGRRRSTLKGSNRADIVLFNKYDKPTCVIEVKRTWNTTHCLGDLRRMGDLLESCSRTVGGSLRRGLLAMCIAKNATNTKTAKDRIREQADKIEDISAEGLDRKNLRVKFELGGIRGAGEEFSKKFPDWRVASFSIDLTSGNR